FTQNEGKHRPLYTTKNIFCRPADMASSSSYLSEEQLQCSICLDVFTDPVSTPCGHNFCMGCINEYWDNCSQTQCPLCKEIYLQRPELRVNTFISELAAQFRKLAPEKFSSVTELHSETAVSCDACTDQAVKSCLDCGLSFCKTHLEPHMVTPKLKKHKLMDPVENLEDYICKKHERPLQFFCRDDQTCVCQFCTELNHKDHNTVPVEEECGEKKSHLMKMQMKMQQMIQDRLRKIQEIKDQVAVRKAEGLVKDLHELEKISHIEDHLQLLQVSISLSATSQDNTPHTLFRKQMEKIPALLDVTLDPDSAHPNLILSADGKQVRHGDKRQNLPDNPERFDSCVSVLGKKGFSSGRFYYKVEVRGKTNWDLGVARESINRKGDITETPQNGYWTVCLRNGNEYSACAGPPVLLYLSKKPQNLGVFVDYEEGLVSFYDVENSSHIYSFICQTFSEKLYPYFSPGLNDGGENSAPLIISPAEHHVLQE
uniref:Bloodthirsty n=1 Tax=Denticeps clupeoides TaxID=299321 RepID=A0AAY4A4N2_9TELE